MAVGSGGGSGGGSGSEGTGNPGTGAGGNNNQGNNNQGSGGSMGNSGSSDQGGGGWGGGGNYGGGGGNGNGGSSGSGSNAGQEAAEAAEAASKGRRDTATEQFGGLVGAAEKGLGLAEKGPSELGKLGWSGPGHESRAAASKAGWKSGVSMGAELAGINAVGSVASNATGGLATSLGIGGLEAAAKEGMTADEARGFKDVQSQKTGLAGWGPGVVGAAFGPQAGMLASVGVAGWDAARQTSYAQSHGVDVSKSEGRRDTATNSFSGGGNSSGSYGQSLAGNSTATAPVSTWQPSSIGFGEYDSHLKGLLS